MTTPDTPQVRPRAEHMAWAKRRALATLDAEGPQAALQSILSDLGKHPDTNQPVLLFITMAEIQARPGHERARTFIEGFN